MTNMESRIVAAREVRRRKEWAWERHTTELNSIDNYNTLKSWVAGIWLSYDLTICFICRKHLIIK